MRFAQGIWENPRGNRLGRGVWNYCEAIIAAWCGALERPYGQIRAHGLNWNQRLGEGQELRRLTLRWFRQLPCGPGRWSGGAGALSGPLATS
jgi:hypothetical protein